MAVLEAEAGAKCDGSLLRSEANACGVSGEGCGAMPSGDLSAHCDGAAHRTRTQLLASEGLAHASTMAQPARVTAGGYGGDSSS